MKSMFSRQPYLLPGLLSVTFIFLISFGCKKNPWASVAASGYLPKDKDGNCYPIISHGTYYNGIPAGADSNYIEMNVFVTSIGAYDINTYRRNGVQFQATGIFSDTGLQSIHLKPIGTFLAPGELSYPVAWGDSSSCMIGVAIRDSLVRNIPHNSWEFTADGHTYRGFQDAPIYQLPQQSGYSFEFDGWMASGSHDTTLVMDTGFPAYTNGLDTLDHPTSTPYLSDWVFRIPVRNYAIIYSASSSTAPGAVINIHFNARVAGTISGRFNGTALDSAGKVVNITNSKFRIDY